MRTLFLLSAGMIVLTTLAGCESVDSGDIKTSGIYGEFDITGDTTGDVDVVARLRVGGASSNTTVDLSDGNDYIEATANGIATKRLSRKKVLEDVSYSTSFSGINADTDITINFNREDEESAPNSTVTLPAPLSDVTIASSSGSGTVTQASDNIILSWNSPSTGNLSYDVSGGCMKNTSGNMNAATASPYTISGTLLEQQANGANTCSITVVVEQSNSGTVDSAFGEGGSIKATQSTQQAFTIVY